MYRHCHAVVVFCINFTRQTREYFIGMAVVCRRSSLQCHFVLNARVRKWKYRCLTSNSGDITLLVSLKYLLETTKYFMISYVCKMFEQSSFHALFELYYWLFILYSEKFRQNPHKFSFKMLIDFLIDSLIDYVDWITATHDFSLVTFWQRCLIMIVIGELYSLDLKGHQYLVFFKWKIYIVFHNFLR